MKSVLRKLVLFGVSFGIIFAVVIVYSRLAGPEETTRQTSENTVPNGRFDLEPIKRIGQREGALQYGEKLEVFFLGPNGRIEREYHAQRFTLPTEDQALLEDVKLIWHLKDGQILTLTSQQGLVDIERGAMGQVQPTRGLLTGNVQIVLDANPEEQPKRRPLGQQ